MKRLSAFYALESSINFIIVSFADKQHVNLIAFNLVDHAILPNIHSVVRMPFELLGIVRVWVSQELQNAHHNLTELFRLQLR